MKRAELVERLRSVVNAYGCDAVLPSWVDDLLTQAADMLARDVVPPGYPEPVKRESLCSKGRGCGICTNHDMWWHESPNGEDAWSRRTKEGVLAVAWAHFEGRDWTEVDA